MNDIDSFVYMNKLLSVYGELLSNSQREILSDYYGANLSISEIAEERNISRAAVDDSLKKGRKKLLEFEKTLKIIENRERISSLVNEGLEGDNKDEVLRKIEEVIL